MMDFLLRQPSIRIGLTQQLFVCNLETKVWHYGVPLPGPTADLAAFLCKDKQRSPFQPSPP